MKCDYHIPVLLQTAVEYTVNSFFSEHIIVDGTAGGGSYSGKLCEVTNANSLIISIDKDENSLKEIKLKLNKYKSKLILEKGNFSDLKKILSKHNINKINGLVLDLGLSTFQLESEDGFSYLRDTPLDMRADKDSKVTAEQIINNYDFNSLSEVLEKYGEIRNPGFFVRGIIDYRKVKRIETTFELNSVLKKILKLKNFPSNRFLSRFYQALRIAVNGEIEDLTKVLNDAYEVLTEFGRIVVVSYHSLEDRIVKNFFRSKSVKNSSDNISKIINPLNKKVIVPDYTEIKSNPRARSAKLRAGEIRYV